ncbi:MAG: DoxX family protein, partial [Thermodesulfovibrionales bacterium]
MMFKSILKTDNSISPLFIRLALGAVMFAHGSQKVLGWFGGAGFEKTIQIFSGLHFPFWMTLLLMFIEFFGSLGLIFGFLTRPSALGIGAAMAACAYMNHLKNGFFMNWFGQQKGEGFEFHVLVVGICLA